MTAKELRQSLRRGSFVYPFLGIQFLAVCAMAAEFQMGHAAVSSEYEGMLNLWLLWNSGPFWMVVSAICLFLMPLSGVILMGQELEEGNHELLLLTKLDRWKIVFGKFITLWGLCALTFVSLLPYVVVRYMVGGIEWWHEAACATTILGGSAMISAGAIGASAFQGMGGRPAVRGGDAQWRLRFGLSSHCGLGGGLLCGDGALAGALAAAVGDHGLRGETERDGARAVDILAIRDRDGDGGDARLGWVGRLVGDGVGGRAAGRDAESSSIHHRPAAECAGGGGRALRLARIAVYSIRFRLHGPAHGTS